MKKITLLFLFVIITTRTFSQLPEDYLTETLSETFAQPMGTVFNSDGTKMFVWTNGGLIYVMNWNGSEYIKQTDAVLDLSEEVGVWRDFGLLSICLDPNFDSNGLIYLYYPVDRHHLMNFGTPSYDSNTDEYFDATIARVTRYKLNHLVSPITTDLSSRTVLLGESPSTGIPLTYESHAGGTLLFGSDGTLLLTTGEGASYTDTDSGSVSHTYYQQALTDGIIRPEENVGAFRSQMINSHSGKVLRIDPSTGDGISSNPFYDSMNPRSPQSRMYAMGFRNPFRASIDTSTGSSNPADANPGMLFVADVGWKDWEDLHIIDKPGLNAGWPLFEGQTEQNAVNEPTSFDSYYFDRGTTVNQDEPGNPTFISLLSQPTSFIDDANPTNRRYIHRRPAVASRQHSSRSRVPWFNGSTPTDPRVNLANSPTTGNESRANSFIAGVLVNGSNFGPTMTGKFLYADYVRDWINVATLNSTNTPWFSDVSTFAPNNFSNGIVHLIQNPLDGSIYYTNIIDGTIRRLYYDNVLNTANYNEINFEIYPNPATKKIQLKGLIEPANIEIFNMSGQLVLSNRIEIDNSIDIAISSGVYFVKINSETKTYKVKKLIVN